MYQVINHEYPRLETYLCFKCGFYADVYLIQQNGLYEAFQRLFYYSKNKQKLKLKNYSLPDEMLHQHNSKSSDEDDTQPYTLISSLLFSITLRETYSKKRESSVFISILFD